MDGNNAIAYYSAETSDFMDPNPQIKWVELLPDLALGKVTEHHKAGLIGFKLSIHDKTKAGPINFEHFDSWKKPPLKRLKVKKVRAYIF